MKKILCLIMAAIMLFSLASPAMAATNIKVTVGGEKIKFDVQPQIINGRTMVPLRAIFEALGASVEWDGATKTITSTKGDTTINLTINKAEMKVNGKIVVLDTPACIKGGRTLVPVRAISEAFNLKVEWNKVTRTVKIRKSASLLSEDSIGNRFEYDENGNVIYAKGSNYSETYTYDANENEIYIEGSDGRWIKSSYDADGNKIYQEDSDGNWEKYTYDANGNMIFRDFKGSSWEKYTYDANGNQTLRESSYNGTWWKNTYDANSNLILYENSYGDTRKYTYDANNNLTYFVNEYGAWEKYTYDANGNQIKKEDSGGNWMKYTYDANGNQTKWETSDGDWGKYTYDLNGNLVYFEKSDGLWEKYIVMEI